MVQPAGLGQARDRNPGSTAELAPFFRSFQAFCSLLKITPLQIGAGEQKARIPMRLTWIQKRICAERTPRIIILKPRRVYVTTLELAYDLWWFLTVRGARVVVICQTTDNHLVRDTLAEQLRGLLASLREHVDVRLDVENATYWAIRSRDASLRILEAGASKLTAQGRTRGITANRIHATEMASWAHAIDTMTALFNTMPQDPRFGSVTIESTPKGAAGPFHDRWKEATRGRGSYKPLFFPWYEHSEYAIPLDRDEVVIPADPVERRLSGIGVSAEALKWRRVLIADKGAQVVAQEFPDDDVSCFLVSGRGFFDGMAVERMLSEAREPVAIDRGELSGSSGQRVNDRQVPALRIWEPPESGSEYVIGADTSEGVGGSAGTGIVIERSTGRHVATLWGQFRPWVHAKHLAALGRHYNLAAIAVERNVGGTVLRALDAEQHYEGEVMQERDGRPGLVTSASSRASMLDTLEDVVRTGLFRTDDRYLLEEMRTFVVDDKDKAAHAPGARDDLVMGAAIAWEAACRRRTRRSTANLPAF